ncbi:MAG TPA: 50S ribosomal protein L3 [Candidatus Acidoferrales bacterium]|nr:50S ribosomal protein L3 [Candidatus Acidoferrales bacterium]
MLTGLVGKKIGMSQVFGADGSLVPVTVIQAGPCVVVQRKDQRRDGYDAIQVGFGAKKIQRVNKPEQGHLVKAGKGAFTVLREFRVDAGAEYQPGQEIKAGDLFKAGDRVDVTGTSKGKGFAGVIKRWGFGGFPASHGTHEYFRHGGSIGNRSFPGRVFKGKKMAGQLGNETVTVQNLEIVAVRPEEHLLVVKGAVPGANGAVVVVRHSVKGRR